MRLLHTDSVKERYSHVTRLFLQWLILQPGGFDLGSHANCADPVFAGVMITHFTRFTVTGTIVVELLNRGLVYHPESPTLGWLE